MSSIFDTLLSMTTIHKIYSSCSHCIAGVPYGHACFSSNNFYINSWWVVFTVTWHIISKTVTKDWCNTSICNAFHVRVVRKLICIIQKLQAHFILWLIWEEVFFSFLFSFYFILFFYSFFSYYWEKYFISSVFSDRIFEIRLCWWMLNNTEDELQRLVRLVEALFSFIWWLKVRVQLP